MQAEGKGAEWRCFFVLKIGDVGLNDSSFFGRAGCAICVPFRRPVVSEGCISR